MGALCLKQDHVLGCTLRASPVATAIANNVAVQGRIMLIPTAMNTSYRLEFNAPALDCQSVPATMLGNVSTSGEGMFATTSFDNVGYISWLPKSLSNRTTPSVTRAGESDVTYLAGTSAHFFVATWSGHAANNFCNGRVTYTDAWEVLRCGLQQANYTIDVETTEQGQSIKVVEKTTRGSIDIGDEQPLILPNWKDNYLTVMNLIGQITTGLLSNSLEGAAIDSQPRQAFIYGTSLYGRGYFKWWNDLFTSSGCPLPPPQSSLAGLLEQLFENVTISLLSNKDFTVQQSVSVTSWTSTLVYNYSWKHLVASYGSGLLVTLIVLIVGYAALRENGASFSNTFSTFLRAANPGDLHAIVAEGAYKGADPLPNSVATTKIRFGPPASVSKSMGDTEEASFIVHASDADSVENARHTSASNGADERPDKDAVSSINTAGLEI